MGGLSLGPDGQGGQQRSYIPPHMRNRPAGPPMNGGPGPNGGLNGPLPNGVPNGPPPMNGLGNSSWAG